MLVTNPTNLYPFHSPSVSMAKVSLLNVLFRVNGSISGNGYTMTSHKIRHLVTLASWLSNKKITSLGTGDLAFVSHGYCNWKDATGEKGAFNTHQKSATHNRAVEVIILFTLPATTANVGEMMSRAHARERLEN